MAFKKRESSIGGKAQMNGQRSVSQEIEWYTPPEYIEAVKEVFGGEIDCDPATCEDAQMVIQAKTFFNKENSCLTPEAEFHGNVFMNPPYDRSIGLFVDKLNTQIENENAKAFITLTNNGTDTGWCKSLSKYANAYCFTDHRIAFIDKWGVRQKGNNKGQMFIYSGPYPQKFIEVFKKFGLCLEITY